MSLTTDEKTLLRQFICDPQCRAQIQTDQGPRMALLTEEDLKTIAAWSDSEARNQLTLYKAQKALNLQNVIKNKTAEATKAQGALDALNAIVIQST